MKSFLAILLITCLPALAHEQTDVRILSRLKAAQHGWKIVVDMTEHHSKFTVWPPKSVLDEHRGTKLIAREHGLILFRSHPGLLEVDNKPAYAFSIATRLAHESVFELGANRSSETDNTAIYRMYLGQFVYGDAPSQLVFGEKRPLEISVNGKDHEHQELHVNSTTFTSLTECTAFCANQLSITNSPYYPGVAIVRMNYNADDAERNRIVRGFFRKKVIVEEIWWVEDGKHLKDQFPFGNTQHKKEVW